MDAKQLLNWVDQAQTHQKIVGEYAGHYALGVTDNPPAFVLRVEEKDVDGFPDKVTINGVEVPVIVCGSFELPKPLTTPVRS